MKLAIDIVSIQPHTNKEGAQQLEVVLFGHAPISLQALVVVCPAARGLMCIGITKLLSLRFACDFTVEDRNKPAMSLQPGSTSSPRVERIA